MRLIILFTIISFSLAAQEEPKKDEKRQDRVVEWLSERNHDFGLLQQFNPEEVSFTFKNISSTVITIDNVRTSCGCTAPDWDLSPIQPDETREIKIEYNSAKTGYFRKKIKVFFNAQKKGDLLYVEGEVEEG